MNKGTITYAEFARRVGDMVLMNKAPDVDPEMQYEGLYNGSIWQDPEDDDNEELKEIFQWYAISDSSAEYIARVSEELVFYSEMLNTHFLAVTHYGTSWEGVSVEVKA